MSEFQNPLSESEFRELESLLKTGDPYKVLESTIQDDKKKIEKKYNELVSEETKTTKEIEAIENAFKILGTEKYRNAYDEYLARADIQEKKLAESLKNVKTGLLSSLCRLLATPFQNVSILANSPFTLTIKDTNEMVKVLYSLKGVRGFYRGFIFNISTISIEFLRVILLGLSKKLIDGSTTKGKNQEDNDEPVLLFIDKLTHLLTAYPVKMIMDCLILSPLSMGVADVIKSFINRNGVSELTKVSFRSNSIFDSFSLSNLYYGAIYVIPLMIASQQIRKFVNFSTLKLKNYVEERQDTINPFIKYSSYLLTNVISTSIIKSALTAPLYVLSSCYPSQLISSYIQGVEVPAAINPITLAIQLYHHNGLSYFYKGIVPLTGFRIFESLARICNPAPIDTYFVSEVVFE
ncbi:hypothetical protein DDB_G0272636 [Dictyostelium discoideum AX4]|uniref:J domain-containing protein n=1 Tax=Dictyostelium discoideum TaxID=44689 RepID=Q556G9_DICDI|nr:hypothetical protein DDB_G0274069 [Dictyostelium discoideum AX4]XP_645020.1 hypothetical protein DDB_G0272636 [Dictyostelium discoideum AX4]EAL70468.1 hypothetical protein DDB_G0274069 [Dictyostelium discoideum AX4]EAL70955.1 hypothetical protein DDB_G0272636 [Dictyostelium discoideum AX4]|eukprot:XP_644393.1 hypothetical protein DDB_G0274069 [Dictyostelium discoideum AX4]